MSTFMAQYIFITADETKQKIYFETLTFCSSFAYCEERFSKWN